MQDLAWLSLTATSPLAAHRDGEPGGAGPGGAGVPHALPPRVPRVSARPHVPVLAEGPGGATYIRVPAGFPGGLLHLDRAPVPAWREPIDPELLLAPGTLPSSLQGAEGWPPHLGAGFCGAAPEQDGALPPDAARGSAESPCRSLRLLAHV